MTSAFAANQIRRWYEGVDYLVLTEPPARMAHLYTIKVPELGLVMERQAYPENRLARVLMHAGYSAEVAVHDRSTGWRTYTFDIEAMGTKRLSETDDGIIHCGWTEHSDKPL